MINLICAYILGILTLPAIWLIMPFLSATKWAYIDCVWYFNNATIKDGHSKLRWIDILFIHFCKRWLETFLNYLSGIERTA